MALTLATLCGLEALRSWDSDRAFNVSSTVMAIHCSYWLVTLFTQ
jgi:hypothetical protein